MFGTYSGREEESTFEVIVMADDTQNYSMFSSRLLVETVGDVTDEALKASRLKDVIGVLAGRIFNWGQRKSLFPLHLGIKCCALEMAAAGASRFDAERFGVFFRSSPRSELPIFCSSKERRLSKP